MRGIASFIAGFGGGYVKAKDKEYDRERQDRLDKQSNELHAARMSEILATQDDRQRERDFREANVAALSTGKTDTGQVVTDAAGSNAYTKDADAAAVLQDMAQTANGGAQVAPATRVLTGMQGATQRGTIPGQQVFTDTAKAQEFAQSMPMSEYAKMQARKAVAEQYGKLEIADDMRGKLENLASKGVFKASSLLDSGNADGALKVLQDMNPDLVPKGAQFKQVDVPDMFDRTKTAKGWALVAPGAEGQPERVLVGDFRDAVFGYLTPQEQFATKHTLNKSALDARKTEVAERQAATAERKIDLLLMGAGRSGGGGGGGSGGGRAAAGGEADAPSFNALGNFDSKKAQAVAFEQAAAAVDANGQPLSPAEQGKRAQQIYRAMEDAFATENRNRHVAATVGSELRAVRGDPAAYAQSYAQALQVMDAAALEAMGFKAPVGAKTAPPPAASERATPAPNASAASPAQPEAPPAYRGGRPAVMEAMFRNSRNTQPAAAAPPEQPRSGRSPQSLGDEFESPMARQALAARVAEAAQGGAPLTKVEALRAQQLRLL